MIAQARLIPDSEPIRWSSGLQNLILKLKERQG
jgi:hypothetical protein